MPGQDNPSNCKDRNVINRNLLFVSSTVSNTFGGNFTIILQFQM